MTDFSEKVAHQARLSAEQFRQRADLNDALDVARPVDHSGVFPDLEGASAACAELTSAGYLTTVSGEGEILVEAQKISTSIRMQSVHLQAKSSRSLIATAASTTAGVPRSSRF